MTASAPATTARRAHDTTSSSTTTVARTHRRRCLGLLPLLALALSVPLVNSAAASVTTRSFNGPKTSHVVTGPSCSSPVGLCLAGDAGGPLNGPFEAVVTGSMPTNEPGISVLTYTSVYHTHHGDLRVNGRGLLNSATSRYSTVDEIAGGTGNWTGASGSWQEFGTFSAAAGAHAEYHGVITTP